MRGLLVFLWLLGSVAPVAAAPEGTLTYGLHVTLAARWLDPAETEALATPFMILYAIHDAMVKPMPAGLNTPSLAESWTASKDGLTYDFLIRKGVKFHNGDRVTHVPIYELAFLWGVSARVEEAGVDLIKGYPYTGPYEDLRVKRP
jgi:ABC-type transport system substrate-binding protein